MTFIQQQLTLLMSFSAIILFIPILYIYIIYTPLFIYAEMYRTSVLGCSVYFTHILDLVTRFIGSNSGKTISFRLFANTIYIYIYVLYMSICGIYITCSSLRNSIDFVIFPSRMTRLVPMAPLLRPLSIPSSIPLVAGGYTVKYMISAIYIASHCKT